MPSHLSLKRLFSHYNRKFFNGELPEDTQVIWSPINGAHGKCWPIEKVIHIDPPLQGHVVYLHIVLLHEMIHLKHPKATHGKVFKAERQRLWELGAYDKLI